MSFLRKMKPHSTSEWIIIALLVVMVAATTVLLITQPFLNDQEDVHLQAIESNPTTESESVSALIEATEKATEDQRPQQNLQVLTDRMKLMASYGGDFVKEQVNPVLRNLRSEQEEREKEADLDLPMETLPLPGGLEVPMEELPQDTIVETVVNTTPAYTGPTSPPPPDPNATTVYTGPTSPLPPDPNQVQAQTNRETSPPLNGQAGANQASPAPPASGENSAQINQQPAPAPPPEAGQAGATPMPSAEKIAQVQGGVVQMINSARAQAGLAQLSNIGTMQTIASQRAGELSIHYHAAPNTHYRPDGSNALVYIANTYGSQYAMGECVAWFDNVGRLSADLIFNAFMNSPAHRSIIMSGSVGSIGVGVYCVPGPVPDNNTGQPNDSNVGRIFVSLNFGT